jgi:hypothetical protein
MRILSGLMGLRIFLILCTGSVFGDAMERDIMIDNFDADSVVRWSYVSDQVMGGISEGSAKMVTDRDNGDSYAHMVGSVSTANNGGFIQLRTSLSAGVDKNAAGVYIKARGNGQKYYIHLRTRGTMLPWQYYQGTFDVSDQWQVIRLPLDAFKASGSWIRKSALPKSIRSIGIVAYGRDHQADIQISEIGFYE